MSESKSSRRWAHKSSRSQRSGRSSWSGRSHRSNKPGNYRQTLEEEDYSPERVAVQDEDPPLEGQGSLSNPDSIISPASTATGGDDDYFVTSPPKPRQGLTGSISTLFRRVASRDHPRGDEGGTSDYNETDILSEEDVTSVDADGVLSGLESQENEIDESVVTTSIFPSSAPTLTSNDEEEDNIAPPESIVGRGRSRTRSTQSKRIFASYTDGSDSDDSYFDSVRGSRSDFVSPATTRDSEYIGSIDESMAETFAEGGLKRYRGFSTSIASLFLDESLVCTSIGCFGLILSNRTEYLLQVRDHIRGVKQSKKSQTADKRSPSKVFSYLLLLTIVLMFMTFVIWGFGNGNALAEDLYNEDVDNTNDDQDRGNDDAVKGSQENDDLNDTEEQENDKGVDDDYYYQNYYEDRQNDDNNQVQANDDQNNNADDDDDAAANANGNNDDAMANNDDRNMDDDVEQANGNDNVNADDDNGQDDDVADQDDGDDYYAADDDGGNGRKLVNAVSKGEEIRHHHRVTGIFKLRDCQESIWDPASQFAERQWNREANAGRSLSDVYYDNYDGSEYEYEIPERDLATDIRTALFLTFLLFLGVLGRRRRMRTRFQLVRARAQDDRLYQIANSGRSRNVSMKDELEDKAYEVACSHTILGCYPIDPPLEEGDEEELGVNDQGVTTSRKKAPKHEDFVSRGFKCLMASCCGVICKCWFQCLSVCALAQEAREMRLLLPPRYQRIDYITHQPFSEYQKDVNELRRGWMGKKRRKSGLLPHYNALSRLSRYILCTAGGTFFVILATLLFNPRAAFSWPDAVLLIATFVQSFLVLYIVHWLFHKSDLSLDAVIKFFAAGFVIAVPSACFFEGILVNIILISAWTVYEICQSLIGDTFATWMASNYKVIWVLGELFNAYIVAAVIEELCKYYTFRSVEHPDLIFLTGLDRKSHDEHAAEGGLTSYPFGAHKVSDLNRNRSFDAQKSNEDKLKKILPSTNTMEEFYEDENDVRTYRQKAAAVTTGMISVAVGLACAENMMYVFLLGGARGSATPEHRGDVYEEWIVLLFRSVFPIHALAAALQSTNMVRKFVEGSFHNNHRIGVGRIILPAVILHGTFDAILMGINVYVESAWDTYLEENEGRVGDGEPYNPRHVNFVAWCSICMVTLIGFLWFVAEYRSQQARLQLLEEQNKEEASYVGPVGTTQKSGKERQRQGRSSRPRS